MKGKWLGFISALLIASMVLAACGAAPPPTAAPTTAGPTAAPTTAAAAYDGATCPLTPEPGATLVFSGWGTGDEQTVNEGTITRFKAICPDIAVSYLPIPSDFQTKMKAQMAGGTAPDVFYVDNQLMTAFAPSGQLLALDDLMKQANVSSSQFIQTLLGEFVLTGKTYALPKDWGTLGLVYLPDAFTNAGIPEPTQDWDWNALRTAAVAISKAGKYKGFCQGADWARFGPWLFSDGGDFTTADWKTATIDTPQFAEMAQLNLDMVTEGSLVQATDVGASWCGEAIGKELVGMTLEGGWMVNFMRTTYPNVTWKTQLIPKGKVTRADIIFTNGLGINASTKYPMAAAAFLFFATSTANQGAIQQTGFAYSSHPEQVSQVTNAQDVNIAAGGLLPDAKNAFWGSYTGGLETAIANALSRIYLKQQSVADSLKQGQTEAQTALNGQ